MRKKFTIEYLPIAQNDLLNIFEYIFLDNPSAAEQFVNKIDKSILKLESFPELGVVPKDDRLGLLGYRMLVIDNYLAFYVIKDQIIEIRRIIHGKRKFSFLLGSIGTASNIHPPGFAPPRSPNTAQDCWSLDCLNFAQIRYTEPRRGGALPFCTIKFNFQKTHFSFFR